MPYKQNQYNLLFCIDLLINKASSRLLTKEADTVSATLCFNAFGTQKRTLYKKHSE